jgi:transcriptional regulator with XRE-family HTH domain
MARGYEKLLQALAANTKAIREARGLSQEALALEAEVDRTYVSQIERGVCNPSLRVLSQIAHTLQVPVSELVRLSPKSSPPAQ